MGQAVNASDAARLFLLGADVALDDDQICRLYGYPDGPSRCFVRANAISSLDGGATTGGTSGGLGGAGDRMLFALQRELADVIVVGAGTARAENYGGVHMGIAQRERRRARGQTEIPPIALVTRSGLVEHDLSLLTGSEVLPLVLTPTAAIDGARSRVGEAAEVIDCSAADPGQVDLETLLEKLADRGLLRVLTEGGPSLLGAFVAAGLVNEMCLTFAPLLVGGSAPRVAAGGADALTAMRCAHLLTDDAGYLYTRYIRLG